LHGAHPVKAFNDHRLEIVYIPTRAGLCACCGEPRDDFGYLDHPIMIEQHGSGYYCMKSPPLFRGMI
jgi:hypothetical protein